MLNEQVNERVFESRKKRFALAPVSMKGSKLSTERVATRARSPAGVARAKNERSIHADLDDHYVTHPCPRTAPLAFATLKPLPPVSTYTLVTPGERDAKTQSYVIMATERRVLPRFASPRLAVAFVLMATPFSSLPTLRPPYVFTTLASHLTNPRIKYHSP